MSSLFMSTQEVQGLCSQTGFACGAFWSRFIDIEDTEALLAGSADLILGRHGKSFFDQV
eukprot:evm.model.NODE_25358_length_19193_cov_56.069920.1